MRFSTRWNSWVSAALNISFDGVDGWHDWMRGVKGAGENAVRALQRCREHGFVTGVQIVLHRESLPVLRKSIRLLSELGVSGAVVGGINDVGEGRDLGSCILSPEELFEAYTAYLPQFVEDGMPLKHLRLDAMFEYLDGRFSIPLVRTETGEDALLCRSMRNTMYLSPDGYVLPCIPMSYYDASKLCFPNVSESPLAEILGDSDYMRFICSTEKDYFAQNADCRGCAYRKECGGGCRGSATEACHGERFMDRDPFVCWYFLGGYYERALEIIDRLQKALPG